MIRKYTTILLPLAAMAANGNARNQDTDVQRPNVIIIYADDLGYGDLQCYGAKNVKTPNVDRLAREGVRFTNAHAVAATSTPSRYSLLTGEYCWRRPDTGVAAGNAGMIIRPTQYTMADMFKSVGYTTAAFGKWHLGLGDKTGTQDWNAPLPASLGDLGFDYHYIMAATGDRVPCVFIENGFIANYDPSAPIEVSYEKNFPGEPTGRDNPELLYNQKHSHGHDMSIVNGIGRIGYMKGGGKALWKDENIADSITSRALTFMREHKDEPFFMYFATNDVHVPRFPHPRFVGQTNMGPRGDAIVQFDWCVGEIMRTLKELGLEENTLIILSSDNGAIIDDGYADQAKERLNGHNPSGPWRGHKYSAFEGGTTIPAIVRWPKVIQKNKESDVLMSQIDWMKSLGTLIGARFPKGSAPDSQNRLGNLLGKDDSHRPWIVEFSQSLILSIRNNEWKYIEPSDGAKKITWGADVETGNLPTPQLYNMSEPYESENLAEKYPDKVYEFQTLLRKIRNQTDKTAF